MGSWSMAGPGNWELLWMGTVAGSQANEWKIARSNNAAAEFPSWLAQFIKRRNKTKDTLGRGWGWDVQIGEEGAVPRRNVAFTQFVFWRETELWHSWLVLANWDLHGSEQRSCCLKQDGIRSVLPVHMAHVWRRATLVGPALPSQLLASVVEPQLMSLCPPVRVSVNEAALALCCVAAGSCTWKTCSWAADRLWQVLAVQRVGCRKDWPLL